MMMMMMLMAWNMWPVNCFTWQPSPPPHHTGFLLRCVQNNNKWHCNKHRRQTQVQQRHTNRQNKCFSRWNKKNHSAHVCPGSSRSCRCNAGVTEWVLSPPKIAEIVSPTPPPVRGYWLNNGVVVARRRHWRIEYTSTVHLTVDLHSRWIHVCRRMIKSRSFGRDSCIWHWLWCFSEESKRFCGKNFLCVSNWYVWFWVKATSGICWLVHKI